MRSKDVNSFGMRHGRRVGKGPFQKSIRKRLVGGEPETVLADRDAKIIARAKKLCDIRSVGTHAEEHGDCLVNRAWGQLPKPRIADAPRRERSNRKGQGTAQIVADF